MTRYYLPVKVLATKGTQYLAKGVCGFLDEKISFPDMEREPIELNRFDLSDHVLDCFSNDNIRVQIPDIRNHSVVVIHTQVPDVSQGIIELFALLDAIKNAQPKDVLVVFPYMPYSRSDVESIPRSPVMASWMAQTINRAGINRVMLLDPHSSHIRHYFDPAADEISAILLIADYLKNNFLLNCSSEEFVLVFPDTGAFERFGKLGNILNLETVYLTKTRRGTKENPDPGKVIGEVEGKNCLVIDDEILTGNTALNALKVLISKRVKSVSMIAIHPILRRAGKNDNFVAGLLQDSAFERIIITDSVPAADKIKGKDKFAILSISSLLAEAISRSLKGDSLTELHTLEAVKLYK